MITTRRAPRRVAAGAIALVLPLAAAACGTEKQRTVKAEFQAAQHHLESSKAASFTLRVQDSKDVLKGLLMSGDDAASATTADALLGGSLSFTIDPAGAATLGSYQADAEADPATQLKSVNAAISINGAKGPLAQLRLVEGVLYAQVSFEEVKSLVEGAGGGDVDDQLDELAGGDPTLGALLADVKAGKWVKLDLNAFVDDFRALAEQFTSAMPTAPTPSSTLDTDAVRQSLIDAVKPYIEVKDANDDSSDRVLDVSVSVRPALKALLNVLKTTKGLPPGLSAVDALDLAEIDKNVKEGKAKGTIRLADGHLKQVALDLESIRLLSTDPGTTSVAGTAVVFDVDDRADEVQAPTEVSSVGVGELLRGFFATFSGGLEG